MAYLRKGNSKLKDKIMKKNSSLVPPDPPRGPPHGPPQGPHQGSPLIYQIHTKNTVISGDIRKCQLGTAKPGSTDKVVMMVGATGSGKSTLINAMFNYIVDVKLEDPFRFRLVDESEQAQTSTQADKQTSKITAYTLHYQDGFAVPYTLTIIDTPGFDVTRGRGQDKKLIEQIRLFFTTAGEAGIYHIDAVGFIVKATDAHLTENQKYIFESVLSIWGRKIKENIFMLFSFADQNPPAAFEALDSANIPYEKEKCFKFNNSALFDKGKNERDKIFAMLYWTMSAEGFRQFLMEHLIEAVPKSLILSKTVLDLRKELNTCQEANIEDIQKILDQEIFNLELERLERIKSVICQEASIKYTRNKKDIQSSLDEEKVIKAELGRLEKYLTTICQEPKKKDTSYEENSQKAELFKRNLEMLKKRKTMILEEIMSKEGILNRRRVEQETCEAQLVSARKELTNHERNNNFTYTDVKKELVKVQLDHNIALNCSKCPRTCHYPCKAIFTSYIINWRGKCKVCCCSNETHNIQNFKHEYERKTIQKTDATLQSRHEQRGQELKEWVDHIEGRLRELLIKADEIAEQLERLRNDAFEIERQQTEMRRNANEDKEQREKKRRRFEEEQEEMRRKAIEKTEKQIKELRKKLDQIAKQLNGKRMEAVEIEKQEEEQRIKNATEQQNLQKKKDVIKMKLKEFCWF